MQEGIHSGHRDRIAKKFLKYPDSFSDHELLEMFLFAVLPRKDTNELAHRLIKAFGGLYEVFAANMAQLMTVKGVGEKVAAYIVLNGKIFRRCKESKDKSKTAAFSSLEKTREEIKKDFEGLKAEHFCFYLLGDRFRMVFCLEYDGVSEDAVFADVREVARAVSVNKAHFAIMAHNHPSGESEPSAADDAATEYFYYLCQMHGIRLVDHVIFSDYGEFSYFTSKRIEFIRETVSEKQFRSKK